MLAKILSRARLEGVPKLEIPLFLERVSAGFPSPAQDYAESTLDLNELCIAHPSATYFVRAEGTSMLAAGIHPGDVLVVDRALEARHRDVVIVSWDGELLVKRLETRPRIRLVADNPEFPPIDVPDGSQLDVFGVVTFAVHGLRG